MVKTNTKLRNKLIAVALCACDVLWTIIAAFGAYWLLSWKRFNFDWFSVELGFWGLSNVLAVVALCLALGLYSMLFSSVGFPEALRTLMVCALIGVGNLAFVVVEHLADVYVGVG